MPGEAWGRGPGRTRSSHRPAKNTAFSSCGASYTASIFSGSSGQNVATSRGPMGLLPGVTVRQMNLRGKKGTQGNHTPSLTGQLGPCVPPQAHSETSLGGKQEERKVGKGLGDGQSPLCQMPGLRSNLFALPSCSLLQEAFPNYLCPHCLPPLLSLLKINTEYLK